ncbi:hypothetical protein BDZ45DRAFT_685089 [Acephala macrosclerotiorum]|nr:hypothetical protein BDZ45DRAFT_685089 [Acephala macrosclerotiorum]
MSAQGKTKCSNARHSLDVPMSTFNKQLIEKAGKLSASKDRASRAPSRGDHSRKTTSTTKKSRYIRPTGPELVSSKHPSCIGLPQAWTCIHDRFIAYLATHAPLDKNGKIPRHEEKKERWRTEDIAREAVERFPKLGGHIKPSSIEKRLILLDQAGDNDYFKKSYGAYTYEEWGRGI